MTDREQLAELIAKDKALGNQATDLMNQQCEIAREEDKIRAKIIKDEKLLQKGQWKYCPPSHSRGVFYLEPAEGGEEQFPEVLEISGRDYHWEFPLMWEMKEHRNGTRQEDYCARMRFDDGEVRLLFDSNEAGERFVKDFGLELDLSGLENTRKELLEQLKVVDAALGKALNVKYSGFDPHDKQPNSTHEGSDQS